VTLRAHVRSHTADLLRRLESNVRQAAEHDDEETIHDLRVSIRRLRECLRTFKPLYPEAPRKDIRRQLRALMKVAERVRSADIAIDLFKKAKLDVSSAPVKEVVEHRAVSHTALRDALKAMAKRPYVRVWHKGLGL
jgi:CHAD domain-containing protein